MLSAALAFVAAACGVSGALLSAPVPWPRRRAPGDRGSSRFMSSLASAGRLLRPPGAPADLRGRIEAAGRPGGLGAREVMAAKAAAALLGAAGGLPLAELAEGAHGLLIVLRAPAAGGVRSGRLPSSPWVLLLAPKDTHRRGCRPDWRSKRWLVVRKR